QKMSAAISALHDQRRVAWQKVAGVVGLKVLLCGVKKDPSKILLHRFVLKDNELSAGLEGCDCPAGDLKGAIFGDRFRGFLCHDWQTARRTRCRKKKECNRTQGRPESQDCATKRPNGARKLIYSPPLCEQFHSRCCYPHPNYTADSRGQDWS